MKAGSWIADLVRNDSRGWRRAGDFAVYVKFLTYTLRFIEKLTSILTFGLLGMQPALKTPRKAQKIGLFGA